MNNIAVPIYDSKQMFDNIVENKKRATKCILLPIGDAVKQRYNFYEENKRRLSSIHSKIRIWSEAAPALRSCYNTSIFIDAAKATILNNLYNSSDKCPYCMMNSPDSFDHYFDKDSYPEYSAYVPNLVPCCPTCNSKKGTKVFDESGNRVAIHFYYDMLPNYQFLFIDLVGNEDGIPTANFRLKFSEDESADIIRVISNHFENLLLFTRYQYSINSQLSSIMSTITEMGIHETLSEIMNHLRYVYIGKIRIYGYNYWEACIYDGFLRNVELVRQIAKL